MVEAVPVELPGKFSPQGHPEKETEATDVSERTSVPAVLGHT